MKNSKKKTTKKKAKPKAKAKSKPIKLTTVIFDLDGTLIDTEPSAALAVRDCFSSWKLKLLPEDSTYVTGRTWESAFTYLFAKYKLPIPVEIAKQEMLYRYKRSLEKKLHTVPGSAEAVLSLAKKFPLGLVSGSGRAEILWALDQLKIQKCFKIILGAEDYPRSKPEPDGYLKAVDFLECEPKSCVVFEDSTAGIASACKAGLWVVAVTSTNHFNQDLSKAHHHIPDLQPVNPKWIQNLSFD